MKPNYPIRDGYKSSGFGYASDMIHVAVCHDDAPRFMGFLKECGGQEVEVLLDDNIFRYAANHGATSCLEALFASGAKSDRTLDYWLKAAEKPAWGPKARKLA